MSTTLPAASFYRLKAAIHDLITRVGGLERAGALCGYSKTHVQRWGAADYRDLMPLAAVLVLEQACGAPLVTAAMAGLTGLADGAAPTLMPAYVEVAAEGAGLSATMAEAARDGVITPAEQGRLDAEAAGLEYSAGVFRHSLAGAGRRPVKVGER